MPERSEENDEDNDDGPKRISSFQKLMLLFWKNWIIQWNQKIQFIIALLLPFLFLLIIVVLRILVKPTEKDITRYPPIPIRDLSLYQTSVLHGNRILNENGTTNLPKHMICYTPENNISRAIIQDVTKRLRLLGSRPYYSSLHMENDMIEHNFLAAVEFYMDKSTKLNEKGYPIRLNFSLKFPSELRTMIGPIIETWKTDTLFPKYDISGPRNANATDGGAPCGYLREGFLPIQHAVTMTWLQLATGRTDSDMPEVQLQRFPYIDYIFDPLLTGLQQLLPFIILISFIYPSTFVAKYVTNEKELQLKEIMKLMGVYNWLHWTAWYVKSYIMLMIMVAIMMCMLMIKFDGSVAILTYSHWLPMLIFFHFYVASSICFCFMIAVFFSKASTSAAVTGILWFLTYIPYSFAFYYYERLSLFQKLLLSFLFHNTALGFGFHVIMSAEGSGEGLQFSNFLEPVSQDDSLCLHQVILTMIVGGIIYMLICLYVEQIFPGPYGAPQRWNYPFSLKFWRDTCKSSFAFKAIANLTIQAHKVHGTCNRSPNVGIELRNLQKTYGHSKVVKNLNLKLYRNEITVLLGHNGAGKTTTLNMLTGIIPPTAGTALINGKDIRTQLEAARRSLGICPQHDVLFGEMSVRNHIAFFSRLKGVRGEAVAQEVEKYTRIMELEHKSYVTANNLSGGMKRKLCLCCALCGNTRAVLCDEPSSGIDAAGRRRLWDLLLAEKAGRTVLLTTHYMDEANVLGDRIAILSNGELQCYGTPFDLKKRYGLGYRLVCVTEDGCNVDALTELMARHIPDIRPESTVGSEVIYRLPVEYSSKYAELLNDLDHESRELKLDGYGISVATIEDVFVQMNMEHGLKFYSHPTNILSSVFQLTKNTLVGSMNVKNDGRQFRNHSIFDLKLPELNIFARFLMHWQALMYKNVLISLNNYWILITQIAIPIVFTSLTILNSRGGRIYYALPEMLVTPNQYDLGFAVIEDRTSNSSLAHAYSDYAGGFGKSFTLLNTDGMFFEDYILKTAKGLRQKVDTRYVAGVTIDPSVLTVWLNNKPYHTAPLTLNLLHNALARQMLGKEAGAAVLNGPLPYSNDTLPMRLNKGQRLGAEIALNVSLTMSFITAFFVLPVIKERATRAKLLQYLTGLNIFSYWFSQWLWDYIVFIFISILYILTITAFQELGYTHFEDLIRYFAVLLVFGIPALPLSYLFSNCFTDGATGLTRVAIVTALTGTGFFTLVLSLQFEAFQLMHVADQMNWWFRVFPHYCLASGLYNIHIGFNIRRGCSFAGIKKLSQADLCSKVPICCNIPAYFAWRKPGILPEIVYLLCTAVFLFFLLIAIDAKLFPNLLAFIKEKYKAKKSEAKSEDTRSEAGAAEMPDKDKDGIELERQKIQNYSSEERSQLPLIVDSISKRYGKFLAVNKLSFVVDHGECFGLLGINGAGKTSTFKMLTGDSNITSGSAFVEGLNLKTQMNKVFPKIGYCPQFNALFEELTGRQTLRIYCLLRCIQRRRIKHISEELSNFFGFHRHVDKRVRHYSGGNKRKLSVAVAFIGNPLVLYLDEPTCGMDPTAQRQLWQILATIRSYGKSTVLTTHSMEECEALCTRIAIMISGELKCIGSIQQIKNNYSKGLILKIRVKISHKKLERPVVVSSASSSELLLSSNRSFNSTTNHTNADTATGSDMKHERRSKKRRRLTREIKEDKRDEVAEKIQQDTERVRKVKEFIADTIPEAVLKEEINELLTYHLPFHSIEWSGIFQLMEDNREKLHIEDYVITQTRLEEIFLNFVWNDGN